MHESANSESESALEPPPLLQRPRLQIALLGGLVGLGFSIWFRSRFHEDLDDISEWVLKLPALEVVLFGAASGFVTWWWIGRWLGGPRPWPTILWGVLSTPFGLLVALLLANLYATPRLAIALGDLWGAFLLWLYGAMFSHILLIVALERIGPIGHWQWAAGLLLALIGRRLHLRAQLRRRHLVPGTE